MLTMPNRPVPIGHLSEYSRGATNIVDKHPIRCSRFTQRRADFDILMRWSEDEIAFESNQSA
jgi:hypothetical protein